MKITFITTVFNEERTIEKFLDSIFSQTKLPDEIIIVDGGSADNTVKSIKKFASKYIILSKSHEQSGDDNLPIITHWPLKKNKNIIRLNLIIKKGNRSVGRNEAIKNATNDIVACSDAGNILDKNWFKNITAPFDDKKVDVVAGYYKGKADNIFQKCLIPYVLVMPDRVDPDTFLPATRSIAFTKVIWKKVGGFNEKLSHNEDYAFSRQLKKIKANIQFAPNALVYWLPRETFRQASIMFFRFALGDIEANIIRHKVILLFARYLIIIFMTWLFLLLKYPLILNTLFVFFIIYILWAIKKNYKYIQNKKALIILPLFQITADIFIILGTAYGATINSFKLIKKNKLITAIVILYSFFVIIMLPIGTPNTDHPFPYHMDEWHQLSALKAIITHGKTTIPGAAHIPFLYPLLSGVYLVPFVMLDIVNPFLITSPFDNLIIQKKLFEILRSVNILFGIGSILLIAKIAKTYLKINNIIPVYFFTISPILIMLSGYFKYDVGLLFFITLSLALLYKFGQAPTARNYIFASIACGMAMSTKFSAIPLLPLLIFAFFLFRHGKKKNYKWVLFGVSAYLLTFFIIGIPDVISGRGDYGELLHSNLIEGPQVTDNTILSGPWWAYLLLYLYAGLFGHIFYFLSILGLIFILFTVIKKHNLKSISQKNNIFIIFALFLFASSLATLKIGAIGNRVLVLLPFLSLILGIFISWIINHAQTRQKYIINLVILTFCLIQLLESSGWIYTKLNTDPQYESSKWVENKIPTGSTIGIENIPIYQALPNIVLKEFYENVYGVNGTQKYRYQVIDSASVELPDTIIISNEIIIGQIYKESDKKNLVQRLERENYKKIKVFSPDLKYFKIYSNDINYIHSALIAFPLSIAIYTKN